MRPQHQHQYRHPLRTRALVAALACAVGSAQAAQALPALAPGFVPESWQAASDAQLDALRGGFEIRPNLSVSFGFVRSVTINGDLVSEISFHLPDLSNISADQARMVSEALTKANIIQNGIGNRVGASLAGTLLPAGAVQPPKGAPSSTVAEAAAVASPVAVAPPPSTPTPSAPSVPAAQVAPTLPTSVALVPMAPMVPAAVTVVQNTLDNQAIKSMTVIDAGVNSLGLLRSINVQTVLKDALMGAIGVR